MFTGLESGQLGVRVNIPESAWDFLTSSLHSSNFTLNFCASVKRKCITRQVTPVNRQVKSARCKVLQQLLLLNDILNRHV